MKVSEKYLDHLQSVITRHNTNSFMIKGWAITLSSAIFAISATWKEPWVALTALVPIIQFWILDSHYLANERCFVCLYNAAINEYSLRVKNKDLRSKYQVKEDGKSSIDPEQEKMIVTKEFAMNYTIFRQLSRNNWHSVVFSLTISWFYFMLLCFSVGICVLLCVGNP